MSNENTITISVERFQQLIRAEQDANNLKALIMDRYDNYGDIERTDLRLLRTLYCGVKEEE